MPEHYSWKRIPCQAISGCANCSHLPVRLRRTRGARRRQLIASRSRQTKTVQRTAASLDSGQFGVCESQFDLRAFLQRLGTRFSGGLVVHACGVRAHAEQPFHFLCRSIEDYAQKELQIAQRRPDRVLCSVSSEDNTFPVHCPIPSSQQLTCSQ